MNPEARANAIKSTKVWGTMCFVGEGGDVQDRRQPDAAAPPAHAGRLLDLLQHHPGRMRQFCIDRKVDVDKLFTHRWTLDQAEEAYKLFDKQSTARAYS